MSSRQFKSRSKDPGRKPRIHIPISIDLERQLDRNIPPGMRADFLRRVVEQTLIGMELSGDKYLGAFIRGKLAIQLVVLDDRNYR